MATLVTTVFYYMYSDFLVSIFLQKVPFSSFFSSFLVVDIINDVYIIMIIVLFLTVSISICFSVFPGGHEFHLLCKYLIASRFYSVGWHEIFGMYILLLVL